MIKLAIIIVIALIVIMLVMFILKGRASKNGTAIGLSAGQLATCPDKPNCVCSESGTGSAHLAEPLSFTGSADIAWANALAAIASTGGTIVAQTESYIAATYSSSLFGFVDDVELRLDPDAQVIQIRSASREGHSDMGVNQKRVAEIRTAFES